MVCVCVCAGDVCSSVGGLCVVVCEGGLYTGSGECEGCVQWGL